MSKGAATFRKANVKRVIEAAESAGMKIGRVEIDKDGKIALIADNGTTSLEAAPEKAAKIVL